MAYINEEEFKKYQGWFGVRLFEKIKDLLSKKQDKLTAGENVTIDDDNVISVAGSEDVSSLIAKIDSLQNEVTELTKMIASNRYSFPMTDRDGNILTDNEGNPLMATWGYVRDEKTFEDLIDVINNKNVLVLADSEEDADIVALGKGGSE